MSATSPPTRTRRSRPRPPTSTRCARSTRSRTAPTRATSRRSPCPTRSRRRRRATSRPRSPAPRVNLTWTASTDNVAVTNYEIYRNGQLLTTVGNVTSYADTSSAETPYQYVVKARDAKQNGSDASNAATATTLASDGDVHPGGRRAGRGDQEELQLRDRHHAAATSTGRQAAFESYLRFQLSGGNGPRGEREAAPLGDDGDPDGPGVYSAVSTLDRNRDHVLEQAGPRPHTRSRTRLRSRRGPWSSST